MAGSVAVILIALAWRTCAAADTIYWSDDNAGSGEIRALDVSTGIISTVIVGNAGQPGGNNIANPVSMALGPDGNLYVGSGETGNIVRVTPGGAATPYYPAAWPPDGLAFDRAGNLYAAQTVAGTIGKIAPDGTFTTFASGLKDPGYGTFDPAGNLYVGVNFTPSGGDFVRIAPDGSVSAFASGLAGLLWDSEGNLFEGTSAGSVTLTTAGGSTSTLLTGLSRPMPIGVDAAGNLFVYEDAGDRLLLEVSPSGNTTTLAQLPNALAFAVAIPEPALLAPAAVAVVALRRRARAATGRSRSIPS